MKKKIIATVILILTVFGITLRIFYINKKNNEYTSNKRYYNIGEEVQFEKDFFFNSFEKSEGYSITVLDTSYLTVDDFKAKYSINDDSILDFADYIYMIKANFKNNSNDKETKEGVNIQQLLLQESSYISYPDNKSFEILNDFDSLAFSLDIGTEREFIIPFGIDEKYISLKELLNNDTNLVISLYPNKKIIALNSK